MRVTNLRPKPINNKLQNIYFKKAQHVLTPLRIALRHDSRIKVVQYVIGRLTFIVANGPVRTTFQQQLCQVELIFDNGEIERRLSIFGPVINVDFLF